jgi:thiol-disulfide isomerase/thioredoxin
MLARRFLLLLTAVLLGILSLSWAQSDEAEPAPNFHAKTLTGETYNNASVKGKVVLLEFWTTWCPYCKDEESLVDAVDHDLSSKGLVVLAVNVAESKKTVKEYLREHPRACRIVMTSDTNLAAMYQANSYPIYVVIDRDGNIAGEQRGSRHGYLISQDCLGHPHRVANTDLSQRKARIGYSFSVSSSSRRIQAVVDLRLICAKLRFVDARYFGSFIRPDRVERRA